MKTVILALLVLVVVSQGEALQCRCGGTSKICSGPVETCAGSNNVCASIIIQTGPHVSDIQGCMTAHNCALLTNSNVASGRCCRTDMCNR
ncbi:synergistic-like venom protein [Sebastes umbrosus]|uniref:synergistic-like venom protein n=1 Tax=Sebastes umbrosus TaxID=72105 RepID=UPI00189CE635|nr:synergistic-like venom protein [Sebastes umbrosus]